MDKAILQIYDEVGTLKAVYDTRINSSPSYLGASILNFLKVPDNITKMYEFLDKVVLTKTKMDQTSSEIDLEKIIHIDKECIVLWDHSGYKDDDSLKWIYKINLFKKIFTIGVKFNKTYDIIITYDFNRLPNVSSFIYGIDQAAVKYRIVDTIDQCCSFLDSNSGLFDLKTSLEVKKLLISLETAKNDIL